MNASDDTRISHQPDATRARYLFTLVAYLTVGMLLYSSTLDDPFHFDDRHVLLETTPMGMLRRCATLNRSLVHLSFFINAALHGQNGIGYHVVNNMIHVVTAFALFMLILWLPRQHENAMRPYAESWRADIRDALRDRWFMGAFLGGGLFLCHPLATQAVSYLSQRYTSLATLFYVLTLALYVRARRRFIDDPRFVAGTHRWWYIATILSATMAMLCKEFPLSLPFAIIIAEFAFFARTRRPIWRRAMYIFPIAATSLILIDQHFRSPPSLNLNIITELTVIHDQHLPPGVPPTTDLQVPDFAEQRVSRSHYFITQLPIIATIYLRLCLVPIGQSIDHAYSVYTSMRHPAVLLSAAVLSILLVVAIRLLRRMPLAGFGLVLFFVGLGPTSTLIPNSEFVAEHRMYLSLIAPACLFAVCIRRCRRQNVSIIATVVLMVFGWLTIQRNAVWNSELALWHDAAQRAPDKARPHFGLGRAYERLGRVELAERAYHHAVALQPSYAAAYNSLGSIRHAQNDLPRAIRFYRKAVTVHPNYGQAWYNLSLAYNMAGMLDNAMTASTHAEKLGIALEDVFYNRGIIYEKKNQWSAAMEAYKRAIAARPSYQPKAAQSAPVHYNLGLLYHRQHDLPRAATELSKAIVYDPEHGNAAINLAAILDQMGEHEKAVGMREHAISIADNHVRRHQPDIALRLYQQVLSQAPNNARCHRQMAQCLHQMERHDEAAKHTALADRYRHSTPVNTP